MAKTAIMGRNGRGGAALMHKVNRSTRITYCGVSITYWSYEWLDDETVAKLKKSRCCRCFGIRKEDL